MTEQEIFIKAMECQSLEERTHFLDEACSGDAELRERVENLIRQSGQLGSFLEHPPVEAISSPEVESPSEVHAAATVEHDDAPAADESDETFGAETMISDTHDDGNEIPLGYLQPSDKPDSLGRLGHYEVLEVVGRGAFGTVLRAFDEKLQRVVAIKVLSPEMASTSPARKRFLREARSSAAVRHENVVAIYAVEDEPIPYLVMEYIPGKTLQQRLKEHGPLDFIDVLRLGKQIADGLAAAHAEGLIHRDIKPGNILLEGGMNDRVKITDFGLARTADDASMTQSGVIAGTPLYMAPEQAQGQKLDQRADLFSLGSVLYQMLSGRPPFRAPNTVAVLKRVVDDEPRPIQEIIPEVPDWLCNLIGHLHAKDRDNRYSTAQEVSALLQQSIDDLNAGRQPSIPAPNEVQDGSQSTSIASRSKKQQPRKAKAKDPNQPKKSVAAWAPILAVLVGAAAFFLAPRISQWMQTPIPDLPETELQAGLKFDGRDDWVQISGLDWQYPQFTIEAFVTSAPNSDNGTIAFLSSRDQDAKEWMSLFDGGPAEPGKRISGAAAKGKTLYENAYGPFAPGKRQHRALVFDGYKLHYYINGVWQGERQAEPREGLEWNMHQLNIGCNGQQRQFFQGIIDQLQISRIARYEDNFTPPTQLESDERTLAIYKFDEGLGDVLRDSSGNGHDGKIVGATWVKAVEKVAPLKINAPPLAKAPFAADEAKKIQKAWADYLGVPVEKDIVLGQDKDGEDITLTMVLIPPGEFFMGTSDAEKTKWFKEAKAENPEADLTTLHVEGPRHFVRITKPFWLSKYEMTKGQFRQFVDATGYQSEAETSGKGATRLIKSGAERKPELNWDNWTKFNREPDPVVNVSWNDAAKCCEWLTGQHPGMAFLLPTEAQWEFACRAGTKSSSYDCETVDELRAYAQFGEEVFFLKRGGQLKPNAFGLYDMLGNVCEWCADWTEGYDKSPTDDPAGPATPSPKFPYRAIRGGSFLHPMWKVRSTRREFLDPSFNLFDRGFRVAAAIVDEGLPLATTHQVTNGEWIDVIPIIDSNVDCWEVIGPDGKPSTGLNEMNVKDGELHVGSPDGKATKLVFPIDADWTSYELELELTRKTGDFGLAINFPTSHRDCPLTVDARGRAGLILGGINHHEYLDHSFSFENGVKSTLRFVVKRGELDEVVVWDGGNGQIAEWTGNLDSLALDNDEGYDNTRRSSLFVGGGSEFVFHRIRVRMLDDRTATPLRTAHSEDQTSTEEPDQPLTAGAPVNLIALLDPDRDFRDDRLKVEDGKLITPKFQKDLQPAGSVGLIPFAQVPDNYDIKLQIERISEHYSGFNMGLLVDGYHVAVGMDSGYNTKVWGLDFLDNLPAHRPENETCNPGRRLEIGKNTDVTIEVRKNHIRAVCNGETLVNWKGDTNRLSVFEGFKIKKSDGLFFVGQADFIVHKMELIPYEVSQNQSEFDWSDVWPEDAPAPAIAPFDAEQAKAHQEAWAKYLDVPVEYENSIGMKFRLIPPCEFMMGSTPEEIESALELVNDGQNGREWIQSEGPQHKVILTMPVYVGSTEVTQSQYELVMGSNPSSFSSSGEGKDAVADLETGNLPVEMVSWNDAAEFCAKLSQQEDLKPVYFRSNRTVTPLEGMSYRLPTEAEWEHACRAGTTTRFWSGEEGDDLLRVGWCFDNSGSRPHTVGELPSNPYGLYDVHGNVFEWMQDNWDPTCYSSHKEGPAINPYNPFRGNDRRVLRSGPWSDVQSISRSSDRRSAQPTLHLHSVGFRVVLPVDAVKQSNVQQD